MWSTVVGTFETDGPVGFDCRPEWARLEDFHSLSSREGQLQGFLALEVGVDVVLEAQLGLVLRDEPGDLVSHAQDRLPLSRVQGYGETTDTVQADCALLADLQAWSRCWPCGL